MLADGFRRSEAEQALGGPVPGRDGAVERLGDDGVIGGLHHGAEQALALAMKIALGRRLPAQAAEQPRQLGLDRETISQMSSTERLLRNHNAASAARLKHHTVVIRPTWVDV